MSLRELRQNPTSAMDAVEAGEAVVITRRNRPVADLVTHREWEGTTPTKLAAVLGGGVDAGWRQELAAQRAEESRDVWGDDA